MIGCAWCGGDIESLALDEVMRSSGGRPGVNLICPGCKEISYVSVVSDSPLLFGRVDPVLRLTPAQMEEIENDEYVFRPITTN